MILRAIWDVLASDSTYSSTMRFSDAARVRRGRRVDRRAGRHDQHLGRGDDPHRRVHGAALGSTSPATSGSACCSACSAGSWSPIVQANMSHRLGTNQFVVGLTLNVFVVGLDRVPRRPDRTGGHRDAGIGCGSPCSPTSHSSARALFDQSWIQYLLYPLIPLAWWLVYRTRWGLEVRCVGENPQAGRRLGHRRQQAPAPGGVICGSVLRPRRGIPHARPDRELQRRRRRRPRLPRPRRGHLRRLDLKGAIGGCLLFGFFQALGSVFQALGYKANAAAPPGVPYVMALITMLVLASRSRKPAALARPFVRGLT